MPLCIAQVSFGPLNVHKDFGFCEWGGVVLSPSRVRVPLWLVLAPRDKLHALLAVPPFSRTEKKKNKKTKSYIIGIKLRTTSSSVAVVQRGSRVVLADQDGERTSPSYVAFTDEKPLVGDHAKKQAHVHPLNTIFDVKRLMGRRYNDKDLQDNIALWYFTLIDQGNNPLFQVNQDARFTPEEDYLGNEVKRTVIAVPAYFSEAQRLATKNAATIAGLEIHVLVYHLGGGTFALSILAIKDCVSEVLATGGDSHMGKQPFDNRILEHITRLWTEKTGHDDFRKNSTTMATLRRIIDMVKRSLSHQLLSQVEVTSTDEDQYFCQLLSRPTFEKLNMDLFENTMNAVKKLLKEANMTKGDIQEIVLVGGSTRIPKIRKLIENLSDGKRVMKGLSPDEAGAYGAAVVGGIIRGPDYDDYSVLKILMDLFTKLGSRNRPIHSSASKVISTAADNQSTPLPKDNTLRAQFDLTGIPLAPRGVPEIKVTVFMDDDGNVMTVTAVERRSGKWEWIAIQDDTGSIPDEELHRLRIESTRYEAEDMALTTAYNRYQTCLGRIHQLVGYQGQLSDSRCGRDDSGFLKLELDDRNVLFDAVGRFSPFSPYGTTKEHWERKKPAWKRSDANDLPESVFHDEL
ncbi:Hsp70 protein-domain-containing protein [Powellomyces hirtus]|nr:Hsp70 protein-domain-containing protein [Powellomyces hirtus]